MVLHHFINLLFETRSAKILHFWCKLLKCVLEEYHTQDSSIITDKTLIPFALMTSDFIINLMKETETIRDNF